MSNTSVYDMPLPMDTEFHMFFLPHRLYIDAAQILMERNIYYRSVIWRKVPAMYQNCQEAATKKFAEAGYPDPKYMSAIISRIRPDVMWDFCLRLFGPNTDPVFLAKEEERQKAAEAEYWECVAPFLEKEREENSHETSEGD